jgi:23S rRNA pseudouridine1911/1915/1917 synthase
VTRFTVAPDEAGQTLASLVRSHLEGTSWNRARELCARGKVSVGGARQLDPTVRLRAGDAVEIDLEARRMEDQGGAAVLFADPHVVVVDKPAGILTVPHERDDRDTLIERVARTLRRRDRDAVDLGAVQRLDKDTSGVIVFARHFAAKRQLQAQFREHSIERVYLGVAHGVVADATYETWLLEDRGDGLRGSYGHFRRARGPVPPQARRAVTHVRPLAPLRGATLVECRLETGRQHQIRIHLSEAGHPLVGEPVYIRDFAGPVIGGPRVMLHAHHLGFTHPMTGQPLRIEAPPPRDFADLVARLGGAALYLDFR